MHGDAVVVDVRMPVDVSVAAAWMVLTDYASMARFISDLRLSEVLSRRDNVLLVHQIGETRFGLLDFTYDTVRKIVLTPMVEIDSTLASGNFKSYHYSTRLLATSAGCVVVNHGEYVPLRWVPPIVGPVLIKQATQNQYEQLRAEMLRRVGENHDAPAARPAH
jgi:hypothetical protein